MTRTRRLGTLGLSVVISGVAAATAWAASSPTVTSHAASKVATTGAVLNATVNPNGSATDYTFAYGPTTAYGATTAAHSAGSGTKAVSVSATVTGLTPGTVYHGLLLTS